MDQSKQHTSDVDWSSVSTEDIKKIAELQANAEDAALGEVQLKSSASGRFTSLVVTMLGMLIAATFGASHKTMFLVAVTIQLVMYGIDRMAAYGMGKLKQESSLLFEASVKRLPKK